MIKNVIGIAILSLVTLFLSEGQATLITFDPPPLGPTGGRHETSYQEQNVLFTGSFGHYGTSVAGSASNDSSGIIKLQFYGSMRIEMSDSSLFGLVSIDLAEYSYVFILPKVVSFTGYLSDGSSISQSFITDGIFDSIGGVDDFETFYFPEAFSKLDYVLVNSPVFAMDNLSIQQPVPEPATVLLFATGLVGFAGSRIRRKK